MANPGPQPTPAPHAIADAVANADANAACKYAALEARLDEVEWNMLEQRQWVEATLFDPFPQLRQTWNSIKTLAARLEDIEAYLGLLEGGQPVVLDNGIWLVYHYEGG
jgi:hypothetical protein